MMSTPWLPTWLAVVWTAAYLVIVVLHVGHAARMTGVGRWWHSGHIVMAVGMADMFWPHDPGSFFVPKTAWSVVFAVGTLAALAMAVASSLRDGRVNRLWVMVAVDFAAMTWMWNMNRYDLAWLTVLFIVWSVIEAVGWLSGALVKEAAVGLHTSPAAVQAQVHATHPHDAGQHDAGHGDDAGQQDAGHGDHVHHDGAGLRISLAVMALGMAYMFAVMQFGMPSMAGMSHQGGGQMNMTTPGGSMSSDGSMSSGSSMTPSQTPSPTDSMSGMPGMSTTP